MLRAACVKPRHAVIEERKATRPDTAEVLVEAVEVGIGGYARGARIRAARRSGTSGCGKGAIVGDARVKVEESE